MTDLAQEMDRWLPGYRPELVVDVGAHRGNFIRYAQEHWGSRAIAYEPSERNVDRLIPSFDDTGDGVVDIRKRAVGRMRSQGWVHRHTSDPSMDRVSLIEPSEERVSVVRLDQENLSEIGFLKIDTEGMDRDVVVGAAGLLRHQMVDLVQVEAGMNPDNRWHAPMEELKTALENWGYRLFSIGETAMEWPEKRPVMRRADLIFISMDMSYEYRGNGAW